MGTSSRYVSNNAQHNPQHHNARNKQQDGVQRGLVGEVIKRFEQRGYTLRALKVSAWWLCVRVLDHMNVTVAIKSPRGKG